MLAVDAGAAAEDLISRRETIRRELATRQPERCMSENSIVNLMTDDWGRRLWHLLPRLQSFEQLVG
jgi:hypothetical protein